MIHRLQFLQVFVVLFLLQPWWAEASSPEPARPVTNYMIVVTGSELLTGVYADGHTLFITRTLHPLGLHCVGSISVDDSPADIQDALRFAVGKADLVIVTGGLGPTDNDVTARGPVRVCGDSA